MYISRIVLLSTLHLQRAVCQLHLNKTGRKKMNEKELNKNGFNCLKLEWEDTHSMAVPVIHNRGG